MSSARRAASLAAEALLRRRRGPCCAGSERALPPSAPAMSSLTGRPTSRCHGFFSSSSSSLLARTSLGDLDDTSSKSSSDGSCFDGVGGSDLRPQRKKKSLLIHSAATVTRLPTAFSSFAAAFSSSSFSKLHDPIAIPAHPCHQATAAAIAEAEAALLVAAKEKAGAEAAEGGAAAASACLTAAQKLQKQQKPKSAAAVRWQDGGVPLEAKERILRQKACVVWLTGLPASGKSAVAAALERELGERNRATALLDGDNVRHGLCADLGFSPEDRAENVRRVGEAARLLSCGGGSLIAIAALVSPYAAHRDAVRASLPPGRFVEVFVDSPPALCVRRDPKGLYRAARAGELRGLTGIDAPYERPRRPELTVRPREAVGGPEAAAAEVVRFLEERGLIPPAEE